MNKISNIIVLGLILLALGSYVVDHSPQVQKIDQLEYSQFMEELKKGNISSVVIDEGNRVITAERFDKSKIKTVLLSDPKLVDTLFEKGVTFEAKEPRTRIDSSKYINQYYSFVTVYWCLGVFNAPDARRWR